MCSSGGIPRRAALLKERVHSLRRLGAREQLGRDRGGLGQSVAPAARRQSRAPAPWWPGWPRARTGGSRSCARRPRHRAPPRPPPRRKAAPQRPRPGRRSARRSASRAARKRWSMTRSAGTRIMAGATPTRTSVKANVADSGAAAKSHAAMRPSPPARAWPLTRAMTGAGLSTMAVRMSGMRLGAAAPRSERSAPEQNTVPVAVSTTARTSGSLVASRNARSNSSSRRDDSALRLDGESSVMVRMPPSWWCTLINASVTVAQCRGAPAEERKNAGGIVRR